MPKKKKTKTEENLKPLGPMTYEEFKKQFIIFFD